MSYILEALRKSEQERERERGEVPDIKSVHASYSTGESRGGNKLWLWIFGAVVLVNVVIFAVIFVGDDKTVIAQAPSQPERQSSVQNQDSNAAHSSSSAQTSDSVKQPQQKPAHQAASAGEKATAPSSSPKVVFSSEPLVLDDNANDRSSVTTDATQNSVVPPADEPKREAGLISDLPDSIRKQVPSIAFGGHIYSSSAQRRSVMINGKKRREGEVIGSGLVLSAITPNGAEFEYKGYRFRLNALQDWSYQ